VHDSHAHPTTSTENLFDELKKNRLGSITAMSTNAEDQDLVKQLAREGGSKIVPCFGL
jgi:Tat protein secretion system quality control protein TatD with DNase activity